MVVYPEGTWYHGMTADKIPLFVEQHLKKNQPIEEWVFARNALTTKCQSDKQQENDNASLS
jgi:(2Fe-2S) ferredoxin